MAEKKRIARIGNVSAKGTEQVHSHDGLAQAESNLIFDIMQSMNESQIMSYQQLKEFKSKDKSISRTKNNEQSSSKPDGKVSTSKQVKKFIPEKTFPLMAKCQKSMKYLKKNRCIPKPRAHVGFPKPPQKPILNLNLNILRNHDSDNTSNCNESSMKMKQKSKRRKRSPEMNIGRKKANISQTCGNSCDKSNFETEDSKKECKFIISSDTDSDNELEKFFKKHHPEKCKSSDSSVSSSSPRKKRRKNKAKRKRKNQVVYFAKKSKSKMTQKTLSESEESVDSQVEHNENKCKNINDDNYTADSGNRQLSRKRFHRIIEQENSNDSVSDTCINYPGTLNYSSPSCSDDEILATNTSNNEIINPAKDLNHSAKLDMPPASCSVELSTSLSKSKDSHYSNDLKLKRIKPCFVILKRDPLIEKKAALFTKNLFVTSIDSDSCDDDCIIIDETNSNFVNVRHPVLKKSLQGESVDISNSSFVTEESTDIKKPNKTIPSGNLIKSSDLGLVSMKNQKDDVTEKEINISDSSKTLSDTENGLEKEGGSKTIIYSDKNFNSGENEGKSSLNYEKLTSAKGNDTFNVQILSVKSLNDCDVIVLSDDNEENDDETVKETNETAADDSDVEIICLDSSIIKENKFINGNVCDVANKETREESCVINETSSNSAQPRVLNDEDCIILNIDDRTEITCVENVQQSSQINIKEVEITNKEKNSNNSDEPIKISNKPDFDKSSILNLLDTIDFNCIKNVLNATSTADNGSKADNSVKAKNPFNESRTNSISENMKQSRNNAHASLDMCAGSSEINKISNLQISPIVTCEKHANLVNNSHDMHNIKNDEIVSNPVESNNVQSSIDKNITFSSANLSASNVSENEIASHKMKESTLCHSQTKQLLPFSSKKESRESASDVLDILAAQSIHSLDEKQKKSILPLVDLYKAEYKKFMDIRCTEENVTAGLKLLEEKQAKKLMHISSSIKKIANYDICFHKVKNEFVPNKHIKNCHESEVQVLESATRSSNSNWPDDKVRIFNPSVVEGASEILKSQSVGQSSSQEVYNHLINSVCAECGKHATAACSGCAKVFYCSEKCGMSYWNKGHYVTCRK